MLKNLKPVKTNTRELNCIKQSLTLVLLSCLLLAGCSSQRQRSFHKAVKKVLNESSFKNHFRGIMIYDPESGDTLYRELSDHYFTPASNVKIFTLYTALRLLPDRIPAFRYSLKNDTLYISGTGDPTQMHPYFRDSTLFHFLREYRNIAVVQEGFGDTELGPGWAWEDYDGYYAPERSAIPLYGNVVRIQNVPQFLVEPEYFKDSVNRISFIRNRIKNRNGFFFDPGRADTLDIPFLTDTTLTNNLLSEMIGRSVVQKRHKPRDGWMPVYGTASDSVYKRMMQESDNFLSEQLLLVASSTLSDTLDSANARTYVLENFLSDLKQPPRWVDGSGLSRYNLFSPESLVAVLDRMYREIPRERLFSFFAAGGESGTLKKWFPGKNGAYLYSKTGTLSNNYCVSGYLIADSGKVLIISFMNNHYTVPTSEIKLGMQSFFEWVRDHN